MELPKTWRERFKQQFTFRGFATYSRKGPSIDWDKLIETQLSFIETTIAEEGNRLLDQVGVIIMEEHYSDRKQRLLALKELN